MSIQNRIDGLNTEIIAISDEIAMIDAQVIGATAVASYMQSRRNQLSSKKTRLENRKNRLQSIVDNPLSEAEQACVDQITVDFPAYTNDVNNFTQMLPEQRTAFFDIYCQCDNNVTKECTIRHFFGY